MGLLDMDADPEGFVVSASIEVHAEGVVEAQHVRILELLVGNDPRPERCDPPRQSPSCDRV